MGDESVKELNECRGCRNAPAFLIRSRGPECQTPLTDLKILQLEFHHYLNFAEGCLLTISVLQACCAVTTEYGIPNNFVKKSTASLQIKISIAQLNFSNRNEIIF